MKTILEQKERMPISVVTSWVAKGWDEVGTITEMIKSIKESFTNTGNIEEYLQGIVDAYLICIGQMEKFLHDKDYVETPAAKEEVKESLVESGSIAVQNQDSWQKQVDDEVNKLGRVGAATYDDLDRDGFYIDADNKVQKKVGTKKESVVVTDEDWVLDWSLNDTDNPANSTSGSVLIDTNPTAAEIEAAKREVGGGMHAMPTTQPVITAEKHPVENEFYVDFDDDFPAPSMQQLSDEEIEAMQGVRVVD